MKRPAVWISLLASLLDQIGRLLGKEATPTILYVTHHVEITAAMDHVLLLKKLKLPKVLKETYFKRGHGSNFYPQPVELIELGEDRYFIQVENRSS